MLRNQWLASFQSYQYIYQEYYIQFINVMYKMKD